MDSSVNQSDINANKVIGRDDNSRTYHTHLDLNKNNGIKTIAEMYIRILENSDKFIDDEVYHETRDSLLRYMTPRANMKTLEVKLEEAKRVDLIQDALELKESTTKFITRYEASDSGQFILVNILATIASKHRAYIIPAILEGQPRSVIDALIDSQVIGSAIEILNGTGKALSTERMYGLMYYLAGNCHIKWTI
ncbi:ABC-three component system protein [Acinetobacter pittii]